MNKPLPHLTIRSGPWAGTMVRFATVEQLRAVQRMASSYSITSEQVLSQVFAGNCTLKMNESKPIKS